MPLLSKCCGEGMTGDDGKMKKKKVKPKKKRNKKKLHQKHFPSSFFARESTREFFPATGCDDVLLRNVLFLS